MTLGSQWVQLLLLSIRLRIMLIQLTCVAQRRQELNQDPIISSISFSSIRTWKYLQSGRNITYPLWNDRLLGENKRFVSLPPVPEGNTMLNIIIHNSLRVVGWKYVGTPHYDCVRPENNNRAVIRTMCVCLLPCTQSSAKQSNGKCQQNREADEEKWSRIFKELLVLIRSIWGLQLNTSISDNCLNHRSRKTYFAFEYDLLERKSVGIYLSRLMTYVFCITWAIILI